MSAPSPAIKIQLKQSNQNSELPSVVKKDYFDALVLSNNMILDARREAGSIKNTANEEAEEILINARIKADEFYENAYKEGIESSQIEVAKKLVELSSMSVKYMEQHEASLVSIVTTSIMDIVSRFDDVTLVKEVVRKASSKFGSNRDIDLHVSDDVYQTFKEIGSDMLENTVLTVNNDPTLTGGQCRLDNGRMLLIGDVALQVEAVRVAMKNLFK